MSDSQRETSGVRVFRPLASESETLDWSRKERSRVRIGCRSACGNERCELGLADEFFERVLLIFNSIPLGVRGGLCANASVPYRSDRIANLNTDFLTIVVGLRSVRVVRSNVVTFGFFVCYAWASLFVD